MTALHFYPQCVLKQRVLNKALRVAGRFVPGLLMRHYGSPAQTLTKLGSNYGGWFVPTAAIRSDWIIYSLGIGQDISFDEALIEDYGCTVHGFDPTPAAVEHVANRRQRKQGLPAFQYEQVGVWDENTTLKFFEPKTRGWVGSYSALNLQGTDRFIEVPCKTLTTLMQERGHTRIDLLKMDIEGAEYRVLNSLLKAQIPVQWLCVEFDQPVPHTTTRNMLHTLRAGGFILRHVDQWNFTFERITR